MSPIHTMSPVDAMSPTNVMSPTKAMSPIKAMSPTMKTRKGPWSVAATVLLLATGACGGDSELDAAGATEAPPTPVRTVSATLSRRSEPVRTSGSVASRAEMDLAFRMPGYVAEILAGEGDAVREGQVLARLRTVEVDAQVRAAEAQADLASKTLERMRALFADSVVSESALDEARDAHERAQAALEVARFNQAFATIRAPADGRVLSRMVEVSEFVGAGVPVFRLGSTASGWVVSVGVSDRDVVRLSVGDSARVRLPALGGDPLAGRVSEISDAADQRSGTFDVEVTVIGAAGRLRSGMMATVAIVPSEAEELTFLPTQALIDTDGRDAAVFVVEGGRVRRHPVEVVRIGAESVGVRAPGLEGATVVTDGAAYLRDGERVEDRTADLPAPGN